MEAQGKTIGFMSADFHQRQSKGLLIQPVVTDEHIQHLPAMLNEAGDWMAASGKTSMIIEVSGHREQMHEYLVGSGWKKQYTWLALIRWLDERARQEFEER